MSPSPLRLAIVLVTSTLAAACGTLTRGVVTGPESCERAETHTDPFGVTTRGNVFYFGNDFVAVGLVESQGATVLRTLWVAPGAVSARVSQGTQGLFALEDGGRLTLTAAADAPSVAGANAQAVFTQWSVDFALTPDQVLLLARARLTAGKTNASGLEIMMQPPTWTGHNLQTLAICLSGDFRPAP